MSKYKTVFQFSILILFFLYLTIGSVYSLPNQDKLDLENIQQESQLQQPLKTGNLVIRYVFSVAGVLILTYLILKFFAGRQHYSENGDWIQVIDYMPLGTNKGVYLMDIEGKGFILGVTEHQINIISTIDDQGRLDELRGLSIKKSNPSKFKFNLWAKKNEKFQYTLQKHIKNTQEIYYKQKNGDKTYEE